jgi:hypothetical protein
LDKTEDPLDRLIELLSEEATKEGTPLTEGDREVLVAESVKPMPDVLRQRARHLITRILEREPADEVESDQKCFSYALQWAADGRYPNIVALGKEVAGDIARPAGLRGWQLFKDSDHNTVMTRSPGAPMAQSLPLHPHDFVAK